MRVALVSCSKSKKSYRCPARELYSESNNFKCLYAYAKATADKVFILSAKYGLLPEDKIIDPYEKTLNDMPENECREWASSVLNDLREVTNIEDDQFILLAGQEYYRNLLGRLKRFWLPLKSVSLFNWIGEIRKLTDLENETDPSKILHVLFNQMKRYTWQDISEIPFENGIYIMFERGESLYGIDRIVRIGTHNKQNNLKQRLENHFIRENSDGSIFRKNIGKAFLSKSDDQYLRIWELDTSKPQIKQQYVDSIDIRKETALEKEISNYMRNNISFTCFPVDTEDERIKLEEAIIATLNNAPTFRAGTNWLGNDSPIPEIKNSGLWNRRGLNTIPINKEELECLKWQLRFGHELQSASKKVRAYETSHSGRKVISQKTSTSSGIEAVREHISRILADSETRGVSYVDLVSGEIHKQLGLKNRMPTVCDAMQQLKKDSDKILFQTQSGKSSTLKIRYYLNS